MLIGLVGRAGSGKDSVAQFIAPKHLVDFEGAVLDVRPHTHVETEVLRPAIRGHGAQIANADPMKVFCRKVYDFTFPQLWGASEFRNAPDKRYKRRFQTYAYPDAPPRSGWLSLTKGAWALLDTDDLERAAEFRWQLLEKGEGKHTRYAKGVVSENTAVSLHQFVLGTPASPELQIDHINGDGLDNRKANLRWATVQENHQNADKHAEASSPFKGVSWDKERSKWAAKIIVDAKTINLGRFDDEAQAALAYDRAAQERFGRFARLNTQRFLTPREALQELGTGWGRVSWEGTWVRMSLAWAHKLMSGVRVQKAGAEAHTFAPNWVLDRVDTVTISDVRFVNEAKMIRDAGGEVWRITRPEADEKPATHRSEIELQSPEMGHLVSLTLENKGSLDDLYAEVVGALG